MNDAEAAAMWKRRAESAWELADQEANARIRYYFGSGPGTLNAARAEAWREGYLAASLQQPSNNPYESNPDE